MTKEQREHSNCCARSGFSKTQPKRVLESFDLTRLAAVYEQRGRATKVPRYLSWDTARAVMTLSIGSNYWLPRNDIARCVQHKPNPIIINLILDGFGLC